MALVKTGSFTRSGGVFQAISKQLKYVNCEPAKKIIVTFDPFGKNAREIRNFLFYFSTKKVVLTNPYCKVQTKVASDRREPTVEFLLNNGESVLLKCNHLNALEIIKIFNKHISSLVPKEPSLQTNVLSGRK